MWPCFRFLGRDLLVLISSESGDFSINRCVLLKHLPGCTLPKVENIWLDNGCKEYFANEEWIVGYDKFKLKVKRSATFSLITIVKKKLKQK